MYQTHVLICISYLVRFGAYFKDPCVYSIHCCKQTGCSNILWKIASYFVMPYSLCYLILNVQIFCYFNHIYSFWHCPQSVFSVSVLNMFKFDILLGCAFTFLSDMADCVAYCDILLYLYAYYIVSLCIILLKFSKNIIYVYIYICMNYAMCIF